MNNRIQNRRALTCLTLLLFFAFDTGKVVAREGGSKTCFSKSDRFYTVSNVIYAKDAFYAVDYEGRVLRTVDGQEWSIYPVKEKVNLQLHDIAWNGEYFVAVTTFSNDIYRSVDAKTWQHIVQLNGGILLPKLRAYEGIFYLLGDTDSGLDSLPHSKDNGLTWQTEPALKAKHGDLDVADLIRVKEQYYYTIEQAWKIPEITLSGWHMVESTSRDREHEKELRFITGWLAYGNGRFVAAERNKKRVLTSDDGRTWKEHVFGNYDNEYKYYFFDLDWTGKEFILVGKQGTVLRSEKGDTWSKDEVPTDGTLSGIASNGEIHIAVGDPPLDCSKSTSVLVSRDGKNWENVSDKIDQAIHAAEHTVQNPEKTE